MTSSSRLSISSFRLTDSGRNSGKVGVWTKILNSWTLDSQDSAVVEVAAARWECHPR